MARRRSVDEGGRYEVGEKSCPSISAAIGYAMHAVGRDGLPSTLYVREVGQPKALYRIERNEDRSVDLFPLT